MHRKTFLGGDAQTWAVFFGWIAFALIAGAIDYAANAQPVTVIVRDCGGMKIC